MAYSRCGLYVITVSRKRMREMRWIFICTSSNMNSSRPVSTSHKTMKNTRLYGASIWIHRDTNATHSYRHFYIMTQKHQIGKLNVTIVTQIHSNAGYLLSQDL